MIRHPIHLDREYLVSILFLRGSKDTIFNLFHAAFDNGKKTEKPRKMLGTNHQAATKAFFMIDFGFNPL